MGNVGGVGVSTFVGMVQRREAMGKLWRALVVENGKLVGGGMLAGEGKLAGVGKLADGGKVCVREVGKPVGVGTAVVAVVDGELEAQLASAQSLNQGAGVYRISSLSVRLSSLLFLLSSL
jgi:hypothetical protein